MTARVFDCAVPLDRERGLAAAESALAEGGLVVLPTDTAYALAADAFDREAVAALVAARSATALPPVLVGTPESMTGLAADVGDAARALADAFWPGGLTLVCRAQPSLGWGDEAAAVALRMPLHPVALELLARTGPLAATAAGAAGHEAPRSAEAAREALGDAVAVYLDGGPCLDLPASTIVDTTGEVLTVVREGAVPPADLVAVVGPDAWAPGTPGVEAVPA